MKALWLKMSSRIDAMSLRERIMVGAAAIAVVLFAVYHLGLDPLFARQEQLRKQLAGHQNRAAEIDAAITARVAAYAADPDQTAIQRIAELQQQSARLQESLRAVQHGLVPPQQMAALLQQLMRSHGALRTVALRTLPVSGLSTLQGEAGQQAAPQPAAAAVPSGPAGAPKPRDLLYRHGVELVVEGGYLDMLSYMEALERLPSQLFWGRVRLDADAYPTATLTLTLYTLSLDDKWMTL